MPKTLAQARALVRQYIDAPSPVRWKDADIDIALQHALSECIEAYAGNGGGRLDLELSSSTSTTIPLAATPHVSVKSLHYSYGNEEIRIPASGGRRVGMPDSVVRDYRVTYVPEYTIPTDTAHPLIGVGALAANVGTMFEKWVCGKAALELLVKENEKRQGLSAQVMQDQEHIFRADTSPISTRIMPASSSSFQQFKLTWYYDYQNKTIHVMRL